MRFIAMTAQTFGQLQTARPADPVRTILMRPVATVDVAESMTSVAEWLAADEVGAVVVTTAAYGPVGVVSERDVVRLVAARADLGSVEAGEAMSPDLVSAQEEETIAIVAARMLEGGIRHLPVMRGKQLVGIVSMRDVLAVMAR
jgi:CBS domain-containing protein